MWRAGRGLIFLVLEQSVTCHSWLQSKNCIEMVCGAGTMMTMFIMDCSVFIDLVVVQASHWMKLSKTFDVSGEWLCSCQVMRW